MHQMKHELPVIFASGAMSLRQAERRSMQIALE